MGWTGAMQQAGIISGRVLFARENLTPEAQGGGNNEAWGQVLLTFITGRSTP
jgi:hypothetical protein